MQDLDWISLGHLPCIIIFEILMFKGSIRLS